MIRHLILITAVSVLTPSVCDAQQWARKMFPDVQHDFGSVARGAKAQHRFKLKNLYKEDVHISNVRVSCGCISVKPSKKSLVTYEKGELIVDLNTRSFQGQRRSTITVTFDRPFYAEVQLHITAYIRTDVVFSPGAVDFGTVSQGTAAKKKITVNYAGRDDWKIVDVTSAGDHYEVDVVEKSRGGGRVSYELSIRLKDDTPAGYVKQPLTLVTNDHNLKRVPLYVEGRVAPSIAVSPASLSLGVVKPGKKVTRLLVVTSDKPFRILSVDCGDDCFKFKVSEAAKKQHRIPVTFTAGDKPSKVAQSIRIMTDRGGVECLASASVVGL